MTEPSAADRLRWACAEATDRLVDRLALSGFREEPGQTHQWKGLVPLGPDEDPQLTLVELTIPIEYPYQRPRVTPLPREAAEAWAGRDLPDYYEVSASWHLEPSGQMCLFEEADYTELPWADPGSFLDHLRAWLAADRSSWPDDPPALDLDRYFDRSSHVLVYDLASLRAATAQVVELTRRGDAIRVGPVAHRPTGRKAASTKWGKNRALILNLGPVDHPLRSIEQILEVAGGDAALIAQEIRRGVPELIFIYERASRPGVLAVSLIERPGKLVAHRAAPEDTDAVMLRSHPECHTLAGKVVTVVGVGAIGSTVADLLHRSGVGHLHLVDPDRLLPGNLVRHLCGHSQVGRPKPEAVRDTLLQVRPLNPVQVTTGTDGVGSLADAVTLLESCDILVDATADSTASRLIQAASNAGAGRAISVAVLADGYAIRIDHWPAPPGGGLPMPDLPQVTPGVFEVGCSSPVSTTPPAAVWEAASVAARHTIDALLGAPTPAGEERVLRGEDG
ncbi:ThiF family adenylyltransferase [Cellulomonas gilvus]|uniref:ThiF family adenylyltransferase n=1 Tax=Cellulomonas gilvus TaxID=11 RepID=UPI0005A1067C|nr:ThiF family adenylyltransferase [Cellulomonas gilvus]